MSRWHVLLWVIVPYAALTTFVVGHVWRWRRDQFTWTTRSTQVLEGRRLRWGSPLFHFGLLAVIGGHVLGLLVPESATRSLGISESAYHAVSVGAGATSGLAMAAGFAILALRTRAGRARAQDDDAGRCGRVPRARRHDPHGHVPHHWRQPDRRGL